MRRLDPNDIAITRDRQRLELSDVIWHMQAHGTLTLAAYAERLRNALTNCGEYIEKGDDE
jgi:hypothetical protein